MTISQAKSGSEGMSYRQFTKAQIEKVFRYEPENGKLFRRLRSGKIKECITVWQKPAYGYRSSQTTTAQIRFRGRLIPATHIMFMLMEGHWPKKGMMMDHWDCDPSNNKWSNLREVNALQSTWNRHPGGGKGIDVFPTRDGKWSVQIRVARKLEYFGTYEAQKEAEAVAKREIKRIQGDFMHEVKKGRRQ